MENDRKGNGIFLGIIGVATLIVAIIGASFAYFSAQAGSAENAVELKAYEFNASLSMREIYPSDANLIPIDPMGEINESQLVDEPNDTNLAYALNVAKKCTDDQGYKVCALYEITITNGGDSELTLNGSIKTVLNEAAVKDNATPFINLQYRKVTYASNTYTINATPVTLSETAGESVDIGQITVDAHDSLVTYAVIYLNENSDQSSEMGAHYQGQIIYASSEGTGSQLTGTFTAH